MSGLKLVPRIPKWPSTANGSEAASRAPSATGQPARSASPASSTRPPQVGQPQRPSARGRPTAETTPSPGSRTVPQQIAQSSASPTAGESHDQPRPPQSPTAAWPIASDDAQIATTAA